MKKDWDIDLGGNAESFIPYEKRKSVSILLGAGFSVPKGYPTGNEVNEAIQNFDQFHADFAPSGELAISTNGEKPQFQIYGMNQYQKQFVFCKRAIAKYSETNNEGFDYEVFFDFIKSQDIYNIQYKELCNDLIDEFNDYRSYVNGIIPIYNQMVAHLIHDKKNKCWYDGEPNHIGYVNGYNGFLKILQKWRNDHVIHVHTLNHDMLFESFRRTEYLSGMISDGFDEFGSPYYGILEKDNAHYNVRLERYTGRYNTPIRLYKLHGSLDYVLYYRTKDYGILVPDKYVKVRHGIGYGQLLKARKSKIGYEQYPFALHSDFLTGTTSKIQRYDESLLYRKLFKKFRNNLQKSEMLLIIGYGFKDMKINEMVLENFDFRNKQIIIVDPYPTIDTKIFVSKTNANIIQKSVSELKASDIHKRKITDM